MFFQLCYANSDSFLHLNWIFLCSNQLIFMRLCHESLSCQWRQCMMARGQPSCGTAACSPSFSSYCLRLSFNRKFHLPVFNSVQERKKKPLKLVCCTCCLGRLVANCGIEFQHGQCRTGAGAGSRLQCLGAACSGRSKLSGDLSWKETPK